MSKLIVEAIAEYYGERCPDYDEDCFCCKAWAEYDLLAYHEPTPCDELETVAYYRVNRTHLTHTPHKGYDELVTRQNAEEVIAAKDARIEELEADNKRLREALEMSEAAISEFYRYQYGGEMRGSYDGKPEREGLWKAMYKARAALGEVKP